MSKKWKKRWMTLLTEPAKDSESESKPDKPSKLGFFERPEWKRANAIYFRDSGAMDFPIRYAPLASLDNIFGAALHDYFRSSGNWRVVRNIEDIHVVLLSVEVFGLHESWNRRDINLKQALLIDLKKAHAAYAANRGVLLDSWLNFLVTDLWWVRNPVRDTDALVLEIPYTTFFISYPQLVQVLAPDNYWQLRRELDQKSRF